VFHVEEEIASQPALWRQVMSSAGHHGLPTSGEKVAVVGCGTSWFMAQSYAVLREAARHGVTDAFTASEMPTGRQYDRVVLISRSGTTTEVLDLCAKLRGRTTTCAITADPSSPINKAVDTAIALEFADERSVVQTRFATTALALLRSQLGESWTSAATEAEEVLATELPPQVVAAEQFTFLGHGWTVGLAHEAALKLREAALAWSESYPAMEYRHGPISIASPGRVVWMFGTPPAGLADEVARTGATFISSERDPLAELVLAQRVAVAVAVRGGLDPDRPRNLTRSVILGTS
jgi:fructoselysine-6-P-deglycase FrlB-like protein